MNEALAGSLAAIKINRTAVQAMISPEKWRVSSSLRCQPPAASYTKVACPSDGLAAG